MEEKRAAGREATRAAAGAKEDDALGGMQGDEFGGGVRLKDVARHVIQRISNVHV